MFAKGYGKGERMIPGRHGNGDITTWENTGGAASLWGQMTCCGHVEYKGAYVTFEW